MQIARVPGLPFVRQLDLGLKKKIRYTALGGNIGDLPIKSHVCSFATLSLWIIEGAVEAPFGAAAAAEGETSALAPLLLVVGGIAEPPFKCGGWPWGWDGWVIRLWV